MNNIDRKALISRHNPVYARPELRAPLSLGNGEFCYTADFTGLQTFFSSYEYFPLCTMSNWSWHNYADGNRDPADLRLEPFDTWGREVGYAFNSDGQEELFNSLRQNPHRFNLAVLGLDLSPESLEECEDIRQSLNLWEASLDSNFTLWGEKVSVQSFVRSDEDSLCLRLSSPLFRAGKLRLSLKFPYPSHTKSGSDFSRPGDHQTSIEASAKNPAAETLTPNAGGLLNISRQLDGTRYTVQVLLDEGLAFVPGESPEDGGHSIFFESQRETFYMAIRFVPEGGALLEAPEISGFAGQFFNEGRELTKAFWENYWQEGGAIDLGESEAKEAAELERRIVLSQYLMSIQNRGNLPPAETGLTCNSWYGKFHLEMHYWHSAQYPLWGRAGELEKSLIWYKKILGEAQALAKSQGYRGARWPKMCGPAGDNSPSHIAVLLAWQQPHPILMAELCYRQKEGASSPGQTHSPASPARPAAGRAFLEEYREIVSESAEFMLSYIHWDGRRYVLGPPLIPAQERFDPRTVLNPGYEVEYFRWAFRMANTWLRRLGEKERPEYSEAAEKLSSPVSYEGVFPAHENCPNTFSQKPFNSDHPSMLGMLGLLPGEGIDRKIMNDTLDRVLKDWNLSSCWGWDFPMMAMTAARLGRREDAVRFLLMENPKNTCLPNGHNAQAESATLPLYLPGNGGLLLAAAMMAAGWDEDGGSPNPGFPASFAVKHEGLSKYI